MLREGSRRVARRETTIAPARAGRHPGRAALHAAEKRVAARLHVPGSLTRPRGRDVQERSGRWSLLFAPGVVGEPVTAMERSEAWARLLLARWGVVSRDVLGLEDPRVVRWSDVAPALARLEMRGDLRRGEFVALENGSVLFTLTSDGALVSGPAPRTDRLVKAALGALQDLVKRSRDPLEKPRRLAVATADGKPVVSTPLVPVLEGLGFTRDVGRYAWRAL